MVKLLLKKGASAKLETKGPAAGHTPLEVACRMDRTEAARLMLEFMVAERIDPGIPSDTSDMRRFAASNLSPEIVALLDEYRAKFAALPPPLLRSRAGGTPRR